MSRNPFQILGIPRTSTEKDIRSAYARLLKKIDQSKNPEKFIQLREAFDSAILSSKFNQFGIETGTTTNADQKSRFEGDSQPDNRENESAPRIDPIESFGDRVFAAIRFPTTYRKKLERLFSQLDKGPMDFRLDVEAHLIDRWQRLADSYEEEVDATVGVQLERLADFLENFFHWEEQAAPLNYHQASINSILRLARRDMVVDFSGTSKSRWSSVFGNLFRVWLCLALLGFAGKVIQRNHVFERIEKALSEGKFW